MAFPPLDALTRASVGLTASERDLRVHRDRERAAVHLHHRALWELDRLVDRPLGRGDEDGVGAFGEGTVAFEHNGQFRVSDRMRTYYADNHLRPLGGTTDSELYFGLLMDFFSRTGSWPDAIVEAAAFITRDLWVDDPADNPDALNCLLLTPDALYGYSQWEPAKLKPESTPDTYVLRLAERPDAVIVTSTHWAVDAATPLPERAVVEVRRGTLEVTVHPQVPLGGREAN